MIIDKTTKIMECPVCRKVYKYTTVCPVCNAELKETEVIKNDNGGDPE